MDEARPVLESHPLELHEAGRCSLCAGCATRLEEIHAAVNQLVGFALGVRDDLEVLRPLTELGIKGELTLPKILRALMGGGG